MPRFITRCVPLRRCQTIHLPVPVIAIVHRAVRSLLVASLWVLLSAADEPVSGEKGFGRLAPPPEKEVEGAGDVNVQKSSGLFVGVGRFDEDSGLSTLGCAPDDAVALAHAFVLELRMLPARQAYLALGGEPKYGLARTRLAELEKAGVQRLSATKADVLRGLRKASDLASDPTGMLVISFSSHGYEEKGQAYLMPSDGSRRNLDEMGIAMQTLKRELREARARKKLLIVDACREAVAGQTRGEERMPDGLQQAFKVAEGFGVLVSCSAGQLSWEDPELQQGVFTHFLLEGLRPGVIKPGQNDLVRLGDLSAYAAEATREWVRRNRRTDQVPFFEGDEPSRMIPLRQVETAAMMPSPSPVAPVGGGVAAASSTGGSAPNSDKPGRKKVFIFPLSFTPDTEKNYAEWTHELKARGLGAQVHEEIKNLLGELPQLEPYSVDEDSELFKKIISKLQIAGGLADTAEAVISIESNFFFDRTKQKLTGFKVSKETEYHATISLTAYRPGDGGKLRYDSALGDGYDGDPILATRKASAVALKKLLVKMGYQ